MQWCSIIMQRNIRMGNSGSNSTGSELVQRQVVAELGAHGIRIRPRNSQI